MDRLPAILDLVADATRRQQLINDADQRAILLIELSDLEFQRRSADPTQTESLDTRIAEIESFLAMG